MRTVRVLQKLLGIERARVVGVRFDEDDRGQMLVVSLELHKNARSRCPQCRKCCPGYDQPSAPRRWRHLDMGGWRCFLELPATRVECPRHGVKTELVPWARPEARMTRAFDDTVAWMCAHAPMTAVSAYLRVSWRTVSRIVERVVDGHVGLTKRLNGLRRIGIDEIAYRKGRRYLVVVVNHDTGQLVWAGEGAKKETIERFFDELGDVRARKITHISADGAEYTSVRSSPSRRRARTGVWTHSMCCSGSSGVGPMPVSGDKPDSRLVKGGTRPIEVGVVEES
ncbi:helix-turn-helix domain-containing protein [Gordonia sp. NPDC127522]|uniref:helix-turn-helix domain-containing protein n=1 Tax=Gordonia sp. NPDC127522 TaxID=3345390 RepID=UPI00362B648B